MRPREMLARLRDRLRRDQLEAELDEELRYHRQLLDRDAPPPSASRSLGNLTYYREEARAMWSLGLVDDLLHDLRYAARVLRRDLGFTAAVVLTAGLGIGATTAVFGIVNAVILRPLPYAHPERLVSVWTSQAGTPTDRNPTSLPDVRDWQQQATVFDGLAGYAFNRFDLSGPDGETQARAILATGNLYEVIGATPILGRLPRPDEEQSPVVAISYRLWRERFAAAPGAVGATLLMNAQPYTVVGVMPPGFHFPTPDVDLWTTLHSIAASPVGPGPNVWLTSRSLRGYRVVARLAPGVTMPQAERAMNVIEHRLGAAYPDIDAGIDVHVQSVRADALKGVERGLWTVFGAAGLILLLACINVAHLLLARLSSRGRELAVRRALGAHRGRVLRQLVTESVLLGVLGGVAGIVVAWIATRLVLRVSPGDIPRLETVGIDAPTLGFALALSMVTGVLFGAAPALLGWGRGVHENLRTQGGGASSGVHGGRTRVALTAIEVAFAVVLLVGAGLMLRSFVALTSAELGVRQSDVTVTHLAMVGPRYQSDEAKASALENILRELRELPGMTAAGASTSMPPTRIQEAESFEIAGRPRSQPGHEPTAIFIPTTVGYLEALGIPLARGRLFDARDDAKSSQVALVSRELARRYFAGSDPVGQSIDVSGVTRMIVGVTGDAVYEGLESPIRPVIYVPFAQQPFPGVWIAMRSSRDERALAAPVREAIHRVDAALPAYRPQSLESLVAESVLQPRFRACLLGTFGGLALLLASIGIYGVIAYGVAQRRPEIGIRLALGAPTRSVVGLVLWNGMLPVLAGIAAGLGVALLGARLVAGLLYGVAPTDALTFATVTIVLAATGLAAAYLPARRA
ncbi:MAG TPA: ABC transporter permease, partial [Gemmatimonadaceae bacterium]|nr:ABC transporter permease [Gemmatimonadaceae bacterium]